MNKTKSILLFAVSVSLLLAAGCGGGNSSDPNAGFSISTFNTVRQVDQFGNVVSQFDIPQMATLSGVELADHSGVTGTLTSFGPAQTGTQANTPFNKYTATGARAPASWRIVTNLPSLFRCAPAQTDFDVTRGTTSDYKCVSTSFVVVFSVSPGTVDAQSAPGTITISGSGISTTNGMPVVTAYDEVGNVVGQETATSVASDGSSLTINTPYGLTVSNTTYTLSVENIMDDGTQSLAGVGTITVYDVPLDPPPGDPCNDQPIHGEQMPCDNY
jgi:phosphohistidine swiveling domain-containing protein